MQAQPKLTEEMLLGEIDDVLRTMPERATMRQDTPGNLAWFGRASSVMDLWDKSRAASFRAACSRYRGGLGAVSGHARDLAYTELVTTLHEVRYDLQFKTQGSTNVVVGKG